jgi:hypothetical protein
MEHNSLHAMGRRLRLRGFLNHGQKSGEPICEKLLPSKRDIKRITHTKLHILPFFTIFLPNFITFYILQHYGRHVTTS